MKAEYSAKRNISPFHFEVLLDHIWNVLFISAWTFLKTIETGDSGMKRMIRKMKHLKLMFYEGH